MISKQTAQVLSNRLPLAMLGLPHDVVEMLEYKWGLEDGLFHSVKATIKVFKQFKDVEIRQFEDKAIEIVGQVLTEIYQCPGCQVDLRKVGVIRSTVGMETTELYVSEDGRTARTQHDRFDPTGEIRYSCMACKTKLNNGYAVYDFLRRGINRDMCIDYLHKYHPQIIKNGNKKNKVPKDNGIVDVLWGNEFNNLQRLNGLGLNATAELGQGDVIQQANLRIENPARQAVDPFNEAEQNL